MKIGNLNDKDREMLFEIKSEYLFEKGSSGMD